MEATSSAILELPAPPLAPESETPPHAEPRWQIELISDESRLVELRDEWNALAGEIPFRRWEWLAGWWRELRGFGDQLFIVCVRDEADQLVGLAPWFRRWRPGLGRVMHFIGSGIVCSDYLTLLVDPQRRAEIVDFIAGWLVGPAGTQWDAIELEAIDPRDETLQRLVRRLAESGSDVVQSENQCCWQLDLKPSWDEYVATLTTSRRSKVRKLTRNLFDTGRAQVRHAESESDLERGWPILVNLHQRRRRTLGDPGCFRDPRFERFLKRATSQLLAQGRARLQWIELDGEPVAVELDFVGDDIAYLYQSGIEPARENESPGWLGTMSTLRHFTESGFRAYDFIRGNEPYKSQWGAQPVSLVDLRIVPRRSVPRARHRVWLALEAAKHVVRPLRERYRAKLRDWRTKSTIATEKGAT